MDITYEDNVITTNDGAREALAVYGRANGDLRRSSDESTSFDETLKTSSLRYGRMTSAEVVKKFWDL